MRETMTVEERVSELEGIITDLIDTINANSFRNNIDPVIAKHRQFLDRVTAGRTSKIQKEGN
jgi:hypothetical protein